MLHVNQSQLAMQLLHHSQVRFAWLHDLLPFSSMRLALPTSKAAPIGSSKQQGQPGPDWCTSRRGDAEAPVAAPRQLPRVLALQLAYVSTPGSTQIPALSVACTNCRDIRTVCSVSTKGSPYLLCAAWLSCFSSKPTSYQSLGAGTCTPQADSGTLRYTAVHWGTLRYGQSGRVPPQPDGERNPRVTSARHPGMQRHGPLAQALPAWAACHQGLRNSRACCFEKPTAIPLLTVWQS